MRGLFLRIFGFVAKATKSTNTGEIVEVEKGESDAGWYTKGTLQGMLNQQPGRAGMKTPTFESAFYISSN